MFPTNSREPEYFSNPYESFMRRHLQHYGYYTGRNQNYRNGFQAYQEWEKTYGYSVSSDSSDSDSDSDDENQKTREISRSKIQRFRYRQRNFLRKKLGPVSETFHERKDNRLQEELQKTTQVVYNYESGRMVPKLREPRNLYALNKELGPQQAARWPAEVQVLDEKIQHIRYVPAEPEPFYRPTGMERTPMSRGEENGTVVFEYEVKTSFYVRSRVGGARGGCDDCSYTPTSKDDTTLVFESRFESGNMARAVKVGEYDYELWLRNDLYTSKHTQWFYFSVANTRPNVKYRLTIVNLMKPDSLYNYGMKPLMYSEIEAQVNKVGWIRAGSDIKYYKNNLRNDTARGSTPLYSLTWTFECKHSMDTVYFAHCYPYTYTDLQDYLLDISNDPIKSRICKQRVLCRSLAGNLVYILTITSPSLNPEDMKPANKDRDPHKHKKAVVLTSRVHPGESNASWMMKGFLDYLTGNSADAKLLRDNFIFKVVPMLNPDGVIVGNYRCSLAGRDLNRNYKTVLKDAYPSVWHTKNMIRRLLQERDIVAYCDLHGHSRRQNVFIYGCENRHNPQRRLRERIFPSMLNKNAPDKFSFDACKFRVQKSKEGTGRIVMWNMGIMNSYTMEATFCGSSMGKMKGFHFSVADFESMGYHFCDTLLDYCDPDNTKSANVLVELEEKVKQEIMAKIGKEGMSPADIDLSEYSSDMASSDDGGSDSSESDGPPVHLQFAVNSRAAAKLPKKKKKLKTKRERDKQRPLKEEIPVRKTQGPQSDAAPEKKAHAHTGGSHKPEKSPEEPSTVTSHDCLSHVRFSTPKRPRSHDDRTNNGIPTFVQERFEERQQKRNEYLEALTAAYLQHGIPLVKDPVFVKLDPKKGSGAGGAGRSGDRSGDLTISDVRGNSYFRVWQIRPSPRKVFDDYMKSMARGGSVAPLDRVKSSRHLLEISAMQQKQQDYLTHYGSSNLGADKGKLIKQHPNPFDEKSQGKRAKLPWPKGHNPSATYMSYDPDKIVLVGGAEALRPRPEPGDQEGLEPEEPLEPPRSARQRSGRRSRMSMHEEDAETQTRANNQLLDLSSTYPRPVPRIKSAHVTEEMMSAMNSIRDMRESVAPGTPPVDGNYINQLMEETSEQITSLTNEIQGEIEKERKLVREHMVRDQASQQGPRLVSRAVETRSLPLEAGRSSRQGPSPRKGTDDVSSLQAGGLRGREMLLLQQESLTPLHIQRPASTNSLGGREADPGQPSESRAEKRCPPKSR